MYVNRCIACGQEIPEGRQICIACELGISPEVINAGRLRREKKTDSSVIRFPGSDRSENGSGKQEQDKDTLLIVGAGGFGRVVLEYAEKDYVCSFIDDNVPAGTEVDGAKVIGKIGDIPRFKEYTNLIVAIGDNYIRERVYTMATKFGFIFPNIIAESAFISSRASIGTGCIILNNAVIQSGVRAGNGLILNPGVELHNDCSVDDYVLIYTNSVIRSNAHVGKRAWIGSTVTVGTCEVIPDDAVINDKWIKVKPKTFEELWGEIVATNKLPEMAMVVMHKAFSKETKEILVNSKRSGSELADLLNRVIISINNGSIYTIDELVQAEFFHSK